jgi:heme exporter protein B
MTSAFMSILRRDITLSIRQGGGIGTAIGFFLTVVVLLPLGLGPDQNLLARIAPGALWIALAAVGAAVGGQAVAGRL